MEEIDVHILALYEVALVTELQLEAIEMCCNAMVGHGGIARTLDKLSSTDEEWLDMTSHVRDFICNCACCQKMSVIKMDLISNVSWKSYVSSYSARVPPQLSLGVLEIGECYSGKS